jgi:hypothetical protein
MGGMQDMGPIRPEKNEPVFHAPWEGRAFAPRSVVSVADVATWIVPGSEARGTATATAH